MITKVDIANAKVRWEAAKQSAALSLVTLGLLKSNRHIVLGSLISLGYSESNALAAYEWYLREEQEKCSSLDIEMNKLELELSDLEAAYEKQELKKGSKPSRTSKPS